MSTICTDNCLETLSSLVNCSVTNLISYRKSDHTAIKRSFISLRTVNEQKAKMLVFFMVLIFALIFVTSGRHMLDR